MTMSTIGVRTAINMPLCGLGTWNSSGSSEEDQEQSIDWALEAGVRLIDTAFVYMNEKTVGKVLNRWINSGRVKRSDLFIVTKLPAFGNQASAVGRYIDLSLKNLGLDYVDLFLIHAPIGMEEKEDYRNFSLTDSVKYVPVDFASLWGGMEEQVYAGKARSIGLSNFSSTQVELISKVARIPVAVNQVELHLYFQQKKLRATMDELGVRTMSYASFGSTGQSITKGPKVLEDPTVTRLAAKYKKSSGQILLRHLIQQGIIVIPKSFNRNRIRDNFDVVDFELTDEDMERLNGLDQGSKARAFKLDFFSGQVPVESLEEFPFRDDEY